MRRTSAVSAVLAAAASCAVPAVASADSIGVNFVGGGGPNTGSTLAASDVAGLVPQAFFNNATGATGTLTGLVDNFDTTTAANLTFNSPNTWSAGTDVTTANGRLLNGYIDSGGSAATGASVTVTNVPYKSYDLIVYFDTDSSTPRIADYEVTTSAGTLTQQAVVGHSGSLTLAPPYADNSVALPAGVAGGSFIIFPGLTDSTLTLKTNQASLPGVNFRSPISGIQIYGIPEPGTLGTLTVLGGFALTRTRRKVNAGESSI